ncbi:hypothetical protein BJF78_15515 [Pseudonocardia sp. CNS-139]|nr:hypothetical protein BJF78_15515 [Pseudonocardia sp. CNS-139]
MNAPTVTLPPVVTASEWAAATAELRAAEKEATRARDALAARRRRMPMVEFGPYAFAGADGPATLVDVFEGRRQLVVYQFMGGPHRGTAAGGVGREWCEGCCMFSDQVSRLEHLHARDTTLAIVSSAPYGELAGLRERMEWRMPFYSSAGTSFADDCGVGEDFGLSVFLRDGDRVFRTYFTTGRGVEQLGSVWSFLDLTPFGRQETWEDTPAGRPQSPAYHWWHLHDEYPAR